ncbi:putative 26 proteasome complex subunit Sem1 [Pyronema domesticum]|nr:putative 26 proteasome complex subunit Sem1 [Pyronema domesticum]
MSSNKPAAATPVASKDKPVKALEEDDEFEDFPAEDWEDAETDGKSGKSKNLWEESWDDDDNSDDFASQLREELKKASGKNESMS